MKLRDVFDLVTLGVLWGMSFLFIRVAVPEFGTFALMEVRVVLAAVVIVPLVLIRRQLPEVVAHWRGIALMGVMHYAIPFCLYAYAMLTLSAGYSSVINAAAPLFTGVVARVWLGERLDAGRVTGLALGFAGVALLVWDKLAAAGSQDGLAVAATVLAAFCYGFAAVMAKRQLAGVNSLAVAGGSMSAAALVLLPLAIWLWPESPPSVYAWGTVMTLGLVCTALAFVLYFRLIASAGPSKAITVTYLIPVFAIVFGVLFIGEQVTVSMIAGGVVIALGTALATGLAKLHKSIAILRNCYAKTEHILCADHLHESSGVIVKKKISLEGAVDALTCYVHAGFIVLTAFVGANLFQQVFTGFCPAATVLRKFFGFKPACS
jgi:drug/metabolite transporter (DMT)-like permease